VSVDVPPDPIRRRECRATKIEIAALIRRTREEQGLTQHGLGERMGGKAQAEVARWESGQHDISLATLSRIADALGVEFLIRIGPRDKS
jgi:transcriptional regulator with XRE-family HTH domain